MRNVVAAGIMCTMLSTLASCTPTVAESEAIDRNDDRTPRAIEFAVAEGAVYEALVAQELTYQGPASDSAGKPYVTIFTTGAHAARLEQYGFSPRGYAEELSPRD